MLKAGVVDVLRTPLQAGDLRAQGCEKCAYIAVAGAEFENCLAIEIIDPEDFKDLVDAHDAPFLVGGMEKSLLPKEAAGDQVAVYGREARREHIKQR